MLGEHKKETNEILNFDSNYGKSYSDPFDRLLQITISSTKFDFEYSLVIKNL